MTRRKKPVDNYDEIYSKFNTILKSLLYVVQDLDPDEVSISVKTRSLEFEHNWTKQKGKRKRKEAP